MGLIPASGPAWQAGARRPQAARHAPWLPPLLYAALVPALLATLLAAAWLQEVRHGRERALQSAQQGAVLLEHRVGHLLDRVDAALQALALQFFNMHARGRFRAEEFAQFLALQQALLPEVSSLRWVALEAGRGLDCGDAAAAREPALRMLCDDAPRLLKADDGGLIVLGPWADGAAQGQAIVLVRRLGGPAGITAGVVCATLAVSEFSRPMGWMALASRGVAGLWTRDLSLVWQAPRPDGAPSRRDAPATLAPAAAPWASSAPASPVAPATLAAALEKNPVSGTFHGGAAGGLGGQVAAYRSLYRYPFYVVFEQPVAFPIDGWLAHGAVVLGCCLAIFAATAVLCLDNFRMARCLGPWAGKWKGLSAGAAPGFRAPHGREGGRALMPYGDTGLAGLRVLVVDDDAANREVAQAILALAGARVALAADGFEALAWLESNRWEVDIVLMDIQMPGMDGCEAVRRIRRMPAGKNLPVAAISAGIYPTQREAVFAAGMNAFIAKPVEPSAVLAVVCGLAGRGGMARDAENQDGSEMDPPATALRDIQDIEDLPGLRLRQGLATWKNPAIYGRYLQRFARDHQDGVASLLALQPQAALRAVHQLKGSAATLALHGVADAAAAAEQALRAGEPLVQALDPLRPALEVALASIARHVAAAEPPRRWIAAARDVDAAMLRGALSELRAAWLTHEFDEVEPILNTLTAALGGEATEKLWAALHGFDFHAGAIATSELAAVLQAPDRIEPL